MGLSLDVFTGYTPRIFANIILLCVGIILLYFYYHKAKPKVRLTLLRLTLLVWHSETGEVEMAIGAT